MIGVFLHANWSITGRQQGTTRRLQCNNYCQHLFHLMVKKNHHFLVMELLSTCRHVSKRTVCWNLGPILTTTRHFCSVFSKRRGLASSTRVGHNCSMDSSSLLPLREPDGLKPLMIFTFREGEDFYMHNFWDYLIKFCLGKLKLCLWKLKLCFVFN